MARDENMIAALKRERAAYVARGLEDRVAQVDEQLKHYGHEPTEAENAPKGRQAPEETKQTAEDPAAKTTAAKPGRQAAAAKRAEGKD
jgi:hypothetical protein